MQDATSKDGVNLRNSSKCGQKRGGEIQVRTEQNGKRYGSAAKLNAGSMNNTNRNHEHGIQCAAVSELQAAPCSAIIQRLMRGEIAEPEGVVHHNAHGPLLSADRERLTNNTPPHISSSFSHTAGETARGFRQEDLTVEDFSIMQACELQLVPAPGNATS